MPAYMIFMREGPVRDPEEMDEYQRLTMATIGKFDLKPLVAYGDMQAVEGEAPDGVVLLEFPNAEEAMAWYNSPDYQAALPHRLKAGNYRSFLVEGL